MTVAFGPDALPGALREALAAENPNLVEVAVADD